MKNIFKNLSKVKKALLILIGSFILLFLAILLYYIANKPEEQKVIEKPKEEVIIKDNYKYDNGTLIFLSEEDKKLGTYECLNKIADKCYVAYELNEDKFDEEYNIYTDNTLVLKRTKIYFNRFAFIKDGESKTFLYDFVSKNKIGIYEVKSFYSSYVNCVENNYVILKNEEGKYGVVDLDNEKMIQIIPFAYDYLGVIKDNLQDKNNSLVYQKDNNWGIVSFKNKIIYTTKEQITDYNNDYVKTITKENLYNLYKYDESIVLEGYSYIDTLDTLIVTITDNKYLMVNDSELNPLFTDQLMVKNYDYVKKNVYDSNKNLIETRKSYTVNLVNDTLTVYVNTVTAEEEHIFSLLEGKISANNDYYSYSNKSLNFYSDLEKTILIGSYKCTNENNLIESSTTFNNCYLAKDLTDTTKNLVIPIYNNRFIFVYDAPVLVNDEMVKYYLYDLLENKLLGKYMNVYAYAIESTNKGGVYHEEDTPKYVIAVNSSNKYGVLKIDTEEVTKAVSFIYDDIKLQDKYLLGKTSNKWALLDYSGKMILDNTYQLYNIYSEYVVAVDSDKKLFVFDYNKKQIINEPILLENIGDKVTLSLIGENIVITINGVKNVFDISTGEKVS